MASNGQEKHGELETVRDTVESIWVAIVAAFVLRAFLFEAFVIPTGSMAPRLLGEHWALTCPSCGYEYAYGAPKDLQGQAGASEPSIPAGAFCPNCRFPYSREGHRRYVDAGDRVLVLKYLYQFRQPQPWDVVVFKNHQDNRQNYIKRLIGLPGESIEIVHGDIFFRRGEGPWQVRRKPVEAQQAMWQVIYDNDYRPHEPWLDKYPRGFPASWTSDDHRWDLSGDGGRRFVFAGGPAPAELTLRADRDEFGPRYGYNTPQQESFTIDSDLDICTDLKLECTFFPKAADSVAALEMTGMGRRFRAEVTGEGKARLLAQSIEDGGPWRQWGAAEGLSDIRVGRGCQIALAHADFRVELWVAGRRVLASTDEQYPADYAALKARMRRASRHPIETPRVRMAGQGGPLELGHVRVMRDVYYTCPRLASPEAGPAGEFARSLPDPPRSGMPGWGTTDNPITLRQDPSQSDLDEFFVMGDNSPASLDGRQWVQAAPTLRLRERSDGQDMIYQLGTVPRYNLIGRAFFVYWPAGYRVPALPRLPLIPNVGKMRLIR